MSMNVLQIGTQPQDTQPYQGHPKHNERPGLHANQCCANDDDSTQRDDEQADQEAVALAPC
jgi:hypothetical protein